MPNEFGGHENLEALAFLKQFNELVHGPYPGSTSPRSPPRGRRSRGRSTWAASASASSGTWAGCTTSWSSCSTSRCTGSTTTTSSPSASSTRGPRTSCYRSPTTRWSTASARSPARCPATTGSASRTSACSTRSCGPIRARSSSSWVASSAQSDEWSHDRASRPVAARGLATYHRGVQRLVRDLNHVYRDEPSLHEVDFEPAGFQWMDCSDWEQSIVTFCRFSRNQERLLLCACNFTPVARAGLPGRRPPPGFYREVINSDALPSTGAATWATRAGWRASRLPGRPAALGGADPPAPRRSLAHPG